TFNTDIEINYQALYRENAELQKALQALKLNPGGLEESLLRDQLTCAHTTIAQQQILINNNEEMISQMGQLKNVVSSQAERIRQLEQQIEEMDRELCASREAHDLLEFQVLENEENSKCLVSTYFFFLTTYIKQFAPFSNTPEKSKDLCLFFVL
ncbi:hypothetical protein NECAME_03312, partial [Necator americanus]